MWGPVAPPSLPAVLWLHILATEKGGVKRCDRVWCDRVWCGVIWYGVHVIGCGVIGVV